jgi:hypothetical protein
MIKSKHGHLAVEDVGYGELTESERKRFACSSNGCGIELASYLRVTHNGAVLSLQSSAMEPEDVTFYRDLDWVGQLLVNVYDLAREDAKNAFAPAVMQMQANMTQAMAAIVAGSAMDKINFGATIGMLVEAAGGEVRISKARMEASTTPPEIEREDEAGGDIVYRLKPVSV